MQLADGDGRTTGSTRTTKQPACISCMQVALDPDFKDKLDRHVRFKQLPADLRSLDKPCRATTRQHIGQGTNESALLAWVNIIQFQIDMILFACCVLNSSKDALGCKGLDRVDRGESYTLSCLPGNEDAGKRGENRSYNLVPVSLRPETNEANKCLSSMAFSGFMPCHRRYHQEKAEALLDSRPS
jgi:hypothetical protein